MILQVSTQSFVQRFILYTFLLTLVLSRNTTTTTSWTAAAAAASISSLDQRHRSDDDDNCAAAAQKEKRLENIITTWWDDDDDDNVTTNKSQKKHIHKSFLPWWKSKGQPPSQREGNRYVESNEPTVDLHPVDIKPQQQHPLRTDLYKIHCQWRGIATQQQQSRSCNRRLRRKGKGKRALWTSRLAWKDNEDFEHEDTSLSPVSNQCTIDRKLLPYNNDDNSVATIYDHHTFQLEFDPNGYVRLLLHPLHMPEQNGSYNDKSNFGNRFDSNNDIHDFIGTWKLQPNGLIIQIPLPTRKKEGRTWQDHIMEMDFHMNPFGTHPKFTRGLIFLPTDSTYGNPFLKLLRIRPIVGTFTGKGIGIDTVDLTYQQRI
jgi:hypothetical protein